MHEKELQILKDRLRFIDTRRSEIEARLSYLQPGSYEAQELQSERNELLAHRVVAELKIREITGQDDPAERQRRQKAAENVETMRAARAAAIEKQCRETAEHFESLNDYRNARIWRLEALHARQQAEHEIN